MDASLLITMIDLEEGVRDLFIEAQQLLHLKILRVQVRRMFRQWNKSREMARHRKSYRNARRKDQARALPPCAWCGGAIPAERATKRGRLPDYCKDSCRHAASSKRNYEHVKAKRAAARLKRT